MKPFFPSSEEKDPTCWSSLSFYMSFSNGLPLAWLLYVFPITDSSLDTDFLTLETHTDPAIPALRQGIETRNSRLRTRRKGHPSAIRNQNRDKQEVGQQRGLRSMTFPRDLEKVRAHCRSQSLNWMVFTNVETRIIQYLELKRKQKLNHKRRLHEEKEGSKAPTGECQCAVAGKRKREAEGRHRHLPPNSGAWRPGETATLGAHAQLAEGAWRARACLADPGPRGWGGSTWPALPLFRPELRRFGERRGGAVRSAWVCPQARPLLSLPASRLCSWSQDSGSAALFSFFPLSQIRAPEGTSGQDGGVSKQSLRSWKCVQGHNFFFFLNEGHKLKWCFFCLFLQS